MLAGRLLQRNMNTAPESLQLGLEDLLGDLQHARKSGDLGRLALLAYCEVRRWARVAGEQALAQQSAALINDLPHADRATFIAAVDALIDELELVRRRFLTPTPSRPAPLSASSAAG